ncbi:MAG: helix-turn-helix domain-containing protein [Clostridia bacterium]|nr:helix-turn-helix domain-containing protein [Clostridia bacterium]
MDRYAFGNRICELRTQHGYTQEKLGKLVGVSNKAVSKWENGTTQPRLQTLEKIAACFDMSVEELLEYGNGTDAEMSEKVRADINTDIPEEINNSPEISVKMLFGFGFLKIDAQKFLREIKARKGLSNSDISTVLHTSERKIGLWENGLKQPTPKENLKIAAFYYNNCDENDRLGTFMEVSSGLKKTNITYMIGIFLFALYFYVFICPLRVISHFLVDAVTLKAFPPFSLDDLFNYVLPVTALSCGFFIFLKYIKLAMPNIAGVLKSLQLFLGVLYVYLLVDWLFILHNYALSVLLLLFGLYILIMHRIKDTPGTDLFRNISLIAAAVIVCGAVCLYADYVVSKSDQDISYESRLWAAFPLFFYMLLAVFEFFYYDCFNYYNRIKKYFPIASGKTVKVEKKDILIICLIFVFAITYFTVLEVNRGRLFEWFQLLPDVE